MLTLSNHSTYMAESKHNQQTKAHCNTCGGSRNHEALWSEKSRWNAEAEEVCGGDTYDLLKCLGCGSVKLRLEEWCSEDQLDKHGQVIPTIIYYPSAIFRPRPRWLVDLMMEVTWIDGQSIHDLLSEVYVALQNDQRALAAMGIRALLEQVMIEKSGDHGNFVANLKEFEKQGYVSHMQSNRLKTILEAGHAAIHRFYKPSKDDLITLVDITESLIESIYIHGAKIEQLKNGIPPRNPNVKR